MKHKDVAARAVGLAAVRANDRVRYGDAPRSLASGPERIGRPRIGSALFRLSRFGRRQLLQIPVECCAIEWDDDDFASVIVVALRRRGRLGKAMGTEPLQTDPGLSEPGQGYALPRLRTPSFDREF